VVTLTETRHYLADQQPVARHWYRRQIGLTLAGLRPGIDLPVGRCLMMNLARPRG
jgi:hypothetical protein